MVASQSQFFSHHIKINAASYFKEFATDEVTVSLEYEDRRPASVLYRYSINKNDYRQFVIVKIPLFRGDTIKDNGNLVDIDGRRPRLVPKTDQDVKYQFEYSALTAIDKFFSRLNDPRFGTVPILDFIPEHNAIVMEEVQQSSLNQMFAKTSFFRNSRINLDAYFRNAGAWLRQYHQIPKGNDVECRNLQRSDFTKSTLEFTSYIRKFLHDDCFFRWVDSMAVDMAQNHFLEELPSGLGHGDYALRNILVNSDGQITVLDTLARWRVPIYEDIGYFLIELKTNWLQVLSQGLAFGNEILNRYEHEFLSGYFENEEIPYGSVRLYEILVLLDKWATIANPDGVRHTSRSTLIKVIKTLSTNIYFRRLTESLLQDVDNG